MQALYTRSNRFVHQRFKNKMNSSFALNAASILLTSALVLGSHVTYAADPTKVVHTYFIAAETGFDPVATNDLYSAYVDESIFETMFSYDYLASPSKLIPLTATALPEISADGLTYTIHIKKGIYFSNDPVFKGKKRELTAYDYAYSLKRLVDPKLHSPNGWLIEGKLKGVDQLVKQAEKSGKFNYDAPVEGIQTPDRYTLILKLNEVDFNLPMILAHPPTAALAREVVEKYRNAQGFVMQHPIGTGAYVLDKWTPGSRIILKASPSYRGFIWDFKPGNDPLDKKIAAEMTGKKMPQVGVVDIQILEEPQTQWLAFKQKQLDWVSISGQLTASVLTNGKLNPEVAKTGAYLSHTITPATSYAFWNMQDPVVGGLSKEKIALRRAITMAFDKNKMVSAIYNNNATPASFPVPSNIVGYDPNYKTSIPYSVNAANLLLDKFNYKIGADGFRTDAKGKPLTITYSFAPNTTNLQLAELWKRTFDHLHIRFKTQSMQFPEYLKAQKQCHIQMGMQSWIADYPDAENFFQLFYGKNVNASNFNCVAIPQFDRLYEKSKSMPANAERAKIYQQMARILEAYNPSFAAATPYENIVIQPYVLGFKEHPILKAPWKYIDIAKK